MEGRDDRTVLKLIEAATFAGAYSALARQIPEARDGLLRMRTKWSGRVAALAEELCGRTVEGPSGAQPW